MVAFFFSQHLREEHNVELHGDRGDHSGAEPHEELDDDDVVEPHEDRGDLLAPSV